VKVKVAPKTSLALIAAAGLIAACGGSDSDEGAGGPLAWADHGALVAAAEEEGAVTILTTTADNTAAALEAAFAEAYPNIDVSVSAQDNGEGQKVLLELQGGQIDADAFAVDISVGMSDFAPYFADIDLSALAEDGVVSIPQKVINPNYPNMLAASTTLGVLAYNKNMVADADVPDSYDQFLDPKYKGETLVLIEADRFANLAPVWGIDRLVDYSKKLAANDPVWTDGNTAGLTVIGAGEYPFFLLAHFHSAYKVQQEVGEDVIGLKFLDPIEGNLSNIQAIRKNAEHPAAATLFLEFLMSDAGQDILVEEEPMKGSLYAEGAAERMPIDIEGKEVAIPNWDQTSTEVKQWTDKVIEAYGFPVGEVK
jgi:iron(III) transport system substrate-binding protein